MCALQMTSSSTSLPGLRYGAPLPQKFTRESTLWQELQAPSGCEVGERLRVNAERVSKGAPGSRKLHVFISHLP